jgi:hypothetical protein
MCSQWSSGRNSSSSFQFRIWVVSLCLSLLTPWIVVASSRFKARNTAWRNVVFAFDGGLTEAAKVFLGIGALYDGRTALRVPVRVEAHGDDIVIDDGTATAHVQRGDIVADAPIPGVPRVLRLPGGETIETGDHAAVTALWPDRRAIEDAAFALESRWWTAVASVVVMATCTWLIVTVLLPLAAEPLARRISPEIERYLGEQALALLDKTILKPSRLPEEQQDEWSDKFDRFVAGEIGHVRGRHAMRRATGDGDVVLRYLSSHPATEDRIRRAEEQW